MHGIATGKISGSGDVKSMRAIFRLDKHKLFVKTRIVNLRFKIFEVFESALQCVQIHSAQCETDRKFIAFKYSPADAVIVQQIENVSVLKTVTFSGCPDNHV